MANYFTTDAELTAVADAIRAKGGTEEPLVYPQGFVSALAELTGRIQVYHGLQPITAAAKTVTIPVPAPPEGKSWRMVWCGYLLQNYEAYLTEGDNTTILGGVGCFSAGNQLFCAHTHPSMTSHTTVNSNGNPGYWNAGTVITYSSASNTLTLGYTSSSRNLYWPAGAVLEWYLILGCERR